MELNTYGVSPQGLFQNAFIDAYDRFLADRAVKFTPTYKEQVDGYMFDTLIDGSKTGTGYKWIFDYRALQQTRMQNLQQKLNTAFTQLLDRAFSANGAARGGSIPMLRNYWQLWQVGPNPKDANPTGFPTDNGSTVRYYPKDFTFGPGSVMGGANIKALAAREVTFDVGLGFPDTLHPIGSVLYAPAITDDPMYTNKTDGPTPPNPAPAPMGENPFLKALLNSFTEEDYQELYSESSRLNNQNLFREVFIGGSSSDSFGSSLTASLTLSFESRALSGNSQAGKMTIRFNKAVAYYHS